MKGVILAGGEGNRLRPLTHTRPKSLLPIGNRSLLAHAVTNLREAGIRDIGIVLGEMGGERIPKLVGDGSRFGVDITYIHQGEPRGIAHAVGCARGFVGEHDFLVHLGDNVLGDGVTRLIKRYVSADADACLGLKRVAQPEEFGVASVSNGTIESLVEKPDGLDSGLAVIGVYVFSARIFDVISSLEPSNRGEIEITDAIRRLLEDKWTVVSTVVDQEWIDAGTPERLIAANRLALRIGQDGPKRVDIHETATVSEDATIRGPAVVGPDVVLESDAVVGPYTTVGAECLVDRTTVTDSILLEGGKLSKARYVSESILGANATVEGSGRKTNGYHRFIVGDDSRLALASRSPSSEGESSTADVVPNRNP